MVNGSWILDILIMDPENEEIPSINYIPFFIAIIRRNQHLFFHYSFNIKVNKSKLRRNKIQMLVAKRNEEEGKEGITNLQ